MPSCSLWAPRLQYAVRRIKSYPVTVILPAPTHITSQHAHLNHQHRSQEPQGTGSQSESRKGQAHSPTFLDSHHRLRGGTSQTEEGVEALWTWAVFGCELPQALVKCPLATVRPVGNCCLGSNSPPP